MDKAQLALLILALVAVAGTHGWRVKGGRKEGAPAIRLTAVTPPVIHGEGPHYDDESAALYYVDIMGNYVNRFDTTTNVTTKVQLPTNVTLVVPVKNTNNQFVVGIGRNLSLLTWDGQDGTYSSLETIVSVESDKPDNRFNDGKADSTGRLLAGTMGKELGVGLVDPYQGTLYKLDAGSSNAVVVASPVSISNGIAWTDDERTMYYIDSGASNVVSFNYNLTDGTFMGVNKTVFQLNSTGTGELPDGMTIDNKGNLWIAVFKGGRVINVDPRSGAILQELNMPALLVTSVAWGGPDLSDLYVTTSRMGLTQEQLQQTPLAGCVIRVTGLGVSGKKANRVASPHLQ
ncbi:regucalcin-like [Schistocerca americana]|uniref:regucalcin-like n=1 Tax=Schistocerca americana TaxID=7009 RepID=UPI001F4FD9BE|nr:regucalcin-like [Schistocerca americana]